MALAPVHIGLVPTLHFHATGAVTFLDGGCEQAWDDDAPIVLAVAA